MENIYEIIGKLLAALVVGLLAYLTPKAKAWLEANTELACNEDIRRMVESFARAAEQLLHSSDPTGEKRREYVKNCLAETGITINETIMDMVEGAVWEINTETKKALVQDKKLDFHTTLSWDDSSDGPEITVPEDSSDGNG